MNTSKRKQSKVISILKVRPGQEFKHLGQRYIRATEDEAKRHVARDLALERGGVLAYMLWKRGRVPVSFMPESAAVVRS